MSWIPIEKSKKINKDSNDGETETEQRDRHEDVHSDTSDDDISPGEYDGDDSSLISTHSSVTRFATSISGEEEQVEETDHHSASNSAALTSSTVILSAFSCSSGEAQRGRRNWCEIFHKKPGKKGPKRKCEMQNLFLLRPCTAIDNEFLQLLQLIQERGNSRTRKA